MHCVFVCSVLFVLCNVFLYAVCFCSMQCIFFSMQCVFVCRVLFVLCNVFSVVVCSYCFAYNLGTHPGMSRTLVSVVC